MRKIGINYVYQLIYQVFLVIVPLITTPYLSRTLGATEIGKYSYFFAVAGYFSMFILLGVNDYGNRSIAIVRDDKMKTSRTFFSIYALQLIMSLFLILLYIIYSLEITKNTNYSLIFVFLLLSSALDVNWFFFGLEKFKFITLRNIMIKFLNTILIFIFVKSSNDLLEYTLIMVGCTLLSQLILWPSLIKEVYFIFPKFNEIVTHIKPNLTLFISVLAVNAYYQMDKVILGVFSSDLAVGYYAQAEKIVTLPNMIGASLGTVLLPHIANMGGVSSKSPSYIKIFALAANLSMSMSIIIGFGVMALSKEFVPLFYGSGNEAIIPLFLILIPSCMFNSLSVIIQKLFLIPKKFDGVYVLSEVVAGLINIFMNILLVPKYGAIGSALATVGTMFCKTIYQLIYMNYKVKVIKFLKQSIYLILCSLLAWYWIYNLNISTKGMVQLFFIKLGIGGVLFGSILTIYWIYMYRVFKYKEISK